MSTLLSLRTHTKLFRICVIRPLELASYTPIRRNRFYVRMPPKQGTLKYVRSGQQTLGCAQDTSICIHELMLTSDIVPGFPEDKMEMGPRNRRLSKPN